MGVVLVLGTLFAVGTAAGNLLDATDPHPVVNGLPGEDGWPAAVAEVAPGVPVPDLGSASPEQVRRFFASLPHAHRMALAERAPGVVGNLDGVPPALRYHANRLASGPAGRQLLGYDRRGDGTVIEVLGDLATAEHVAVIVPGTGWRLGNTLRTRSRAPMHPVRVAMALLAETGRLDRSAAVAAVVWLGYDAPEAVDRQAMRSERAQAGAPRLARFLDGLPGGAHVSVLGHSYGAVVCGLATPVLPADEVVALAAPGMRASTAGELRIARRVWAARTGDDYIRFAPSLRVAGFGHGPDPVGPQFGAMVFRTTGAHGHDGYYRPGTESLTNLARIVLGRAPQVSLVRDAR